MYAAKFIGNYAKNMASKEHDSGTSMSQMELLRTKGTILWYFTIQCNTKIEARRPDIVIDKTKKEVKIVDVVIPGDEWVSKREVGKTEKYKVLKDEISRIWGMKEVMVIPVVVGALDAKSTGFEKYIAAIEIEMRVEHVQKTALLGTARILRQVL